MDLEVADNQPTPCRKKPGFALQPQLSSLGISKSLRRALQEASSGKIAGIDLPGPIRMEISPVDLAHADHTGTIYFNPKHISKGLHERFKGDKAKAAKATNKIFEEELLHAVHQTCPGFTASAKLIGQAALEGDMKPLQTVATALSLYRRCQGDHKKISPGTLLINPPLLMQGYGELLRMSAQYHLTGETTEMVIRPWSQTQQSQLSKIGRESVTRWHKQIESGDLGSRCRNQYRLLCQVLRATQATPEQSTNKTI